MQNLSIIQTKDLQQFARNNKLEHVDSPLGENFEFEVPPARAILNGQPYLLPAVRLQNFGGVIVRLPEAIIRGQKLRLSTIYQSSLLSSGFSHSFNWVELCGFTLSTDGRHCFGPELPCVDIKEDGTELFVLGITSHFGHFFTDCLDRLLTIERAGKAASARYVVDGAPPAQVRQIINLLGIDFPDSRLLITEPGLDYRARNLHIVSLQSAKPAISISSFKTFRQRVLARLPESMSSPRAIYVGRKAVETRLILNQSEIEILLSESGFIPFYPEEHSFLDAAEAFRTASIVVIVIGSSKFNLALCRPGTRVVCLAPEGYVENSGAVAVMLRQLCAVFQLELCFCSCKVSGKNIGLNSDLTIDNRALDRALKVLQS